RADPALPPGLAAGGSGGPHRARLARQQLDHFLGVGAGAPVDRELLEAGEVEHAASLAATQLLSVRLDPHPAPRPGAGLLALDLDDGVAAALAAVALGPGTHLKSDHLALGHRDAELARERLGAPRTRQLDQRPAGEHREQRLRLPLVDDAGGDDLLLEPAAGVQAL